MQNYPNPHATWPSPTSINYFPFFYIRLSDIFWPYKCLFKWSKNKLFVYPQNCPSPLATLPSPTSKPAPFSSNSSRASAATPPSPNGSSKPRPHRATNDRPETKDRSISGLRTATSGRRDRNRKWNLGRRWRKGRGTWFMRRRIQMRMHWRWWGWRHIQDIGKGSIWFTK